MNKTRIEWTDYTWNPVTGCLNDCWYCYARRFAERGLGEYGQHPKGERFKPRFHLERLDEPAKLKKPSKIFVCSMGELFGDWVPTGWIREILDASAKAPQHIYQWLTKNPERITDYAWSPNDWIGFTVTNQKQLEEVAFWFTSSAHTKVEKRFMSLEPLLGPMNFTHLGYRRAGLNNEHLLEYAFADVLDWVIIGRMTGPGSDKHIPYLAWVEEIRSWCFKHEIPCFIKDNLHRDPQCQEFPRRYNK